ncbi:MAG: FAD-dependent oxidoreductase [Acidobacteriia bacterium]|nr:FAD-dependent oxidoreductase [Terriglobia bacterium]
MRKTYDCVVVGAGCWGAWTALRLRERGRRVALVEAWGAGHARSSSGGASRIIRMGYGADEIYTRWAMRSLADWQRLFEQAGQPELFQRTGVLWTARAGHAHIAGTRAVFDRAGVSYQALAAEEVRQRYPQIRFAGEVTGIVEPESGALLASRAVRAVAAEAAQLGVEAVTGRVLPPERGERLEWVETENGDKVAGGAFVFACGPWLPKLFPRLLGDGIEVTRQEVFYFAAPAGDLRFAQPAMPVWIDFSDERGGYALPPLAGKGFKLALDRHGPRFDPDAGGREASAGELAAARAFLRERFPEMAEAPLLEAEVCQYGNTANGDFVIGRHPEMENVWIAGGGSGHGFKH